MAAQKTGDFPGFTREWMKRKGDFSFHQPRRWARARSHIGDIARSAATAWSGIVISPRQNQSGRCDSGRTWILRGARDAYCVYLHAEYLYMHL